MVIWGSARSHSSASVNSSLCKASARSLASRLACSARCWLSGVWYLYTLLPNKPLPPTICRAPPSPPLSWRWQANHLAKTCRRFAVAPPRRGRFQVVVFIAGGRRLAQTSAARRRMRRMLPLQCVAAAPASRSPHLWRTTPTAAATPAGRHLHLPERPHWAQRCRRPTNPSEGALALAAMTLAVDCSGRSTAMHTRSHLAKQPASARQQIGLDRVARLVRSLVGPA